MACDLHTHSVFSDGTDSPAVLLEKAEALGLSAVALCDHNCVSGLPEFLQAAQGRSVAAVPGVEFSTEYHGAELHILGLFLQPRHFQAVSDFTAEFLIRKEASNRELTQALCRAGFLVDYDQIKAATPDGFVNRAHIAAALQKKGYVASVQEAFATLLRAGGGFYHPPKRPDAMAVIQLIRSLGAVSVLAHPFLSLKPDALPGFLEEAAGHGLDAMEVCYSDHDPRDTALSHDLACRYGLLPSGGSDYHGSNKPHILLGAGRGELCVPDSYFEDLFSVARKRQSCEVEK